MLTCTTRSKRELYRSSRWLKRPKFWLFWACSVRQKFCRTLTIYFWREIVEEVQKFLCSHGHGLSIGLNIVIFIENNRSYLTSEEDYSKIAKISRTSCLTIVQAVTLSKSMSIIKLCGSYFFGCNILCYVLILVRMLNPHCPSFCQRASCLQRAK